MLSEGVSLQLSVPPQAGRGLAAAPSAWCPCMSTALGGLLSSRARGHVGTKCCWRGVGGGSKGSGAALRGCGEKPLPGFHPSLPSTACQQPAQGLAGRSCPLGVTAGVEGRGLCTATAAGWLSGSAGDAGSVGRTCVLGQLPLQAAAKTSS